MISLYNSSETESIHLNIPNGQSYQHSIILSGNPKHRFMCESECLLFWEGSIVSCTTADRVHN